MPKQLIEIASKIVQTQAGYMTPEEISSSLQQVCRTLQEIERAEIKGVDLSQGAAASKQVGKLVLGPSDSIQNDKIICLECGAFMKQLTVRHLALHRMTPKEYKKKYGFTMRTPLSSKSLTKARSKAGKKRGLPENLAKYLETRKQENTKAKPPVQSDNPRAKRLKKVRDRFAPKKWSESF